MFMPGVWFLWSKKKLKSYFSKRKWKYFDTFNHNSSEKSSKRADSTNHPVWPLICRNKPAINPKWFNSSDTNSRKNAKKNGRSDVRSSTFLNIHVQTEITLLPHVCSCSINSARLLVGQMVGESRLSIIYASFVKHFSIDLSLFGFQLFFTNFDQDGKTFWIKSQANQWIINIFLILHAYLVF